MSAVYAKETFYLLGSDGRLKKQWCWGIDFHRQMLRLKNDEKIIFKTNDPKERRKIRGRLVTRRHRYALDSRTGEERFTIREMPDGVRIERAFDQVPRVTGRKLAQKISAYKTKLNLLQVA